MALGMEEEVESLEDWALDYHPYLPTPPTVLGEDGCRAENEHPDPEVTPLCAFGWFTQTSSTWDLSSALQRQVPSKLYSCV